MPADAPDLSEQLPDRREIEIALQQGRQRTEALVRVVQEVPDRLYHVGAVRHDDAPRQDRGRRQSPDRAGGVADNP